MSKSAPISIDNAFSRVEFFENRTPETTNEEAKDAFSLLSEYRDGGIFVAHFSGVSEWERHMNGDEFVQVIAGETTLILLDKNLEQRNELSSGQILVVPKGIWHRFESPGGVKVMTITPQPTEHSTEYPIGI